MLNSFDWIRRSRTGAELIATIKCLAQDPDFLSYGEKLGPPHSAINSPCQRCWIYPRASSSGQEDDPYCKSCRAIINKIRGLGPASRRSLVIWGFVNQLPRQFRDSRGLSQKPGSSMPYALYSRPFLAAYIHDEHHMVLVMHRKKMRSWLQELILYDGFDLKGLLQILPTVGYGHSVGMGDVLCRAAHHEANFPMDQLRMRFYSAPHQLMEAHKREKKGMLTFGATEFLNLLEMVSVFRSLMRPEEQEMLHEILTIEQPVEEQFYWGRFQGSLNQKARDMLDSWGVRQWPENRVKLLYELIDYVYIKLP